MKTRLHTLLFVALLCAPASADTIYVRNQPFKGASQGTGSSCLVELGPLVKALGYTMQPMNGGFLVTKEAGSDEGKELCGPGVVVLGNSKMTLTDGTAAKNLVSLADFCQAAEVKMTPNRQLGTIDIYLPDKGARLVSLKDTWGNKAPAAAAVKSGNSEVPEGAAQAAVAYFAQMSMLPPMRDLAELRDLCRHQADIDRFQASFKNSVTADYYASSWPQFEEGINKAMEGSTVMNGLPAGQLEAAIAADPKLREKFEGAITIWEAMRASSATYISQRVDGDDAQVTVEIHSITQEGKPMKEMGIMHLVKQGDRWKVTKHG
jgi:hypothetical protein